MAAVLVVALQGGNGSSSVEVEAATSTTGDSTEPTLAPSTKASSTESTPTGAGPTTPTTSFAQRLPALPAEPFSYLNELPEHFLVNSIDGTMHRPVVELDSTPVDNPTTNEGATLGRVLFYDVNLSSNHTVRCASCHVQGNGFSDPLVLSQGVGRSRTRRNSMGLANAVFNASGRYFWDERAGTLESQVLQPFLDPIEMALPLEIVVQRIEERRYYDQLFIDAFGDATVNPGRIAAALAQFIRAMVSADAPYDRGRAQVSSPLDPFPNFTDEENRGKQLFYTAIDDGGGGCSNCHTSEAQVNTPTGLKNNGIDPPLAVSQAPDLGRFEVTLDLSELGSFRVPSLRNVGVSGPYMHDGRFVSLEAVVDHYNDGIQPHENLSAELRGPGVPIRMGFDEADKAALVAFLHTLTDQTFLTDERFSEPFRGS